MKFKDLNNKFNYFKTCLFKKIKRINDYYPNCNSCDSTIIETKLIITSLNRFSNCNLMYRTPITSEKENNSLFILLCFLESYKFHILSLKKV